MQGENAPNIQNVWLFFLLTFAITWLILIPKALVTQPTAEPPLFNISLVGTWGPALAAIIMIYRERGKVGLREFFDQIIKWRIKIQWYLALVGVPLFIHLSTVGLHVLRGGSFPEPFSQVPLSMTLPVFLLIMVIGGGNEEPGWRGYALPNLQTKYNATVTSLILGVVWGFWHLPLFFIPGSPQEGVFFPGFLLLIMGRTFILTWFYNNTKSVFGCIVLHTWFNLSTVYFLMPNTTDPIFLLLSLIVLWVAVIVLLAVFGTKRLSRKPEAVEASL